MLPNDVEKLRGGGLSDTSIDSSFPEKNDDDDNEDENPNLSTQDKGKR